MMSASVSFIDPMMSIPMVSSNMMSNMIPNMIPNIMSNMTPNMMSNITPNMMFNTSTNLLSDIMQYPNNTLMPFNFSQNSQLMSSKNNLQNNLMNNSENFLYIVYEF